MQGSRYHLFKFKLKLQKLSFFYLITLFFCSCHICTHLFRFYTSVTLLPAPFTSFFILHTLLFLLYFFLITFCLFFLLFYFLSFRRYVSIYLLSRVFLYSLFFSLFPSLFISTPFFLSPYLLSFLLGHIYSLFMFY